MIEHGDGDVDETEREANVSREQGERTAAARLQGVEVLGATGYVGQHLVAMLDDHPWFRVERVTGSPRSVGRPYGDAVNWCLDRPIPAGVSSLVVSPSDGEGAPRLAFSAVPASVATDVEARYAKLGHLVVSNARSYRMHDDVPLVVPEVNASHLSLIDRQAWPGAIATNPNCSTIGLAMALAPLQRRFGLEVVHVVTLQALSGAGVPGVSSVRALDNVIPWIGGEEEKLETELLKILGSLPREGPVRRAKIVVSASCNRVPVLDGHTESVSVKLSRPADPGEIIEAWTDFRGHEGLVGLPSAPARPLAYLPEADQPQARSARALEGGMAVGIGRLRPCPAFDYKFTLSFHNAIRGAAGGTILLAEELVTRSAHRGAAWPGEGGGDAVSTGGKVVREAML